MDLLMDYQLKDVIFYNGPLEKPYTTQPFVDTVKQRLFILLHTFQTEWFLDTTYGIPYWDWLGRKVRKSTIDLVMQQKILAEEGVKELVEFNSTLVNRIYSLSFRVKVTTGEVTDLIIISPTS